MTQTCPLSPYSNVQCIVQPKQTNPTIAVVRLPGYRPERRAKTKKRKSKRKKANEKQGKGKERKGNKRPERKNFNIGYGSRKILVFGPKKEGCQCGMEIVVHTPENKKMGIHPS